MIFWILRDSVKAWRYGCFIWEFILKTYTCSYKKRKYQINNIHAKTLFIKNKWRGFDVLLWQYEGERVILYKETNMISMNTLSVIWHSSKSAYMTRTSNWRTMTIRRRAYFTIKKRQRDFCTLLSGRFAYVTWRSNWRVMTCFCTWL